MSDLATELLNTITGSTESATRAREAASPRFLEPGDEVGGRYRIERLLGTGGTARVWLADDAVEGRQVALKEIEVLPSSGPDDASESALMFRREFFAMKRLQHPFTLKVYDSGILPSGNRYITMEQVEGDDLRARVRSRPLASEEAFDLLMRLAQTLAFIHARLFVHCDIKADNVRLLPDDSIKLMDFGLMHQLGTPTRGRLWGTAAYIAPEWIGGGAIDGRADLYSLGVLGFFSITGQHPFHASTVQELLRAHRVTPPPAPSSLASVHPELERILLRLLAKDPADRFQSATELIGALGSVSGTIPSEEPLAARASYLHVPTVVGRKREAARLEEALASAVHGHARTLLIGAPAGTGKSRLLSELELYARLSDVAFAYGQCHAEGLAPLEPLRRALRLLLPVTPAELIEQVREPLAALLPPEYARSEPAAARTPAEEKLVVFEALSRWLTELARLRTFVLCFEDLHWADDATVEHLNVIIRALHGTRGLVCGTFRSDELTHLSPLYQTVAAGAAEILELLPLSRDHLRELVALALPGFDVPHAFVANLHAVTRGNVFFATECLRALVEQGELRRLAGRWFAHGDLSSVSLPRSIGEAIQTRLSTLSPDHLDFLQRAAPAGRVLDMPLLRAAAELEDEKLFSSLDEAVERQFLQYSGGHYHFTHDTVHKTVYDATPEETRRLHHGRIAEHLERTVGHTPEGARVTGYHFARSREPSRAIAPLLFASRHLLAHSGMLAGYRILKEAEALLEAHPDYPDRTELQVAAWGKLIEVAYSSETPATFVFADKLFSYWKGAVDLDLGRDIVRTRMSEPGHAPDLYREIQVRANMTAEEAFLKRSEYRILQSIALAIMGRTVEFQAVLDRADADGDRHSPFRAAAHIARGGLTSHTGHFAGIVEEMEEHLTVLRKFQAEKIGAPARLSWALAMGSYFLNMNLALMGKETDRRATEDGMTVASEFGFIELRIYHIFSLLVRASFIGDKSHFAPLYTEMNDWMRRLGNPTLPERNLAIYTPPFYLERREIELGTAIVQRGAHISENVLPGDGWLKLYVAVYRGCLQVLRGEHDVARASLLSAISAAHARDFRMETYALVYLSRLERLRGEHSAARAAADVAFDRATDPLHANPFDEILARRALADLLPGNAGDRELERAREVASESGNVLQEGVTLLTLAERRSSAHPGGARALLSLAQRHLSAAGASVWLERADELRESLR